MLHIIKQYTQLFSSLVQANFTETTAGENYGDLAQKIEAGDLSEANKERLKAFLEKFKTTINDADGISDGDIASAPTSRKDVLAALAKVLKTNPKPADKALTEHLISVLKLQEQVQADIAALKADIRISQVDTSKIVEMTPGSENKLSVAQLQQLLVALGLLSIADVGNNVGIYGPKTKAAVSELQSRYNSATPSKGKKSVTLTVSGNIDANTLKAIKDIQGNDVIGLVKHIKGQGNGTVDTPAPRKAKTDKVRAGELEAQIGKTSVSIDTMIKFLKESSIVLEAIEDGKDFETQGYSLLNIARRLLGTNAESLAEDKIWEKLVGRADVGTQARKFKSLIGNSSFEYNQSNKFDKGFKRLIGSHHFDNNIDHGNSNGNEFGPRALKHAKKILPWVLGIYVADIPLPFIKSAFPNVDMDKAFAFTQWVKAGMPGEFNPKEKVNTGSETLQNLKGLRYILATSTNYIQANKNKESLAAITTKVRELITTYILYRFAPDADVLRSATQNAFENLFDMIGIKGDEAKLITKIIKDAKKGRVNFNDVFTLEAILAQNDRTGGLFGIGAGENAAYLEAFGDRNRYMAGVQRQGDILDVYVAAIYKGKAAFTAVQDADKAVGPAIPETMKGEKVTKLRRGVYGKKLRENMTGEEVLASLQSTRPSKKKNWDSLGWITNNMRALETDMDARKLSYEALAAGIRKGKMVSMSQFEKDMGVVNSGIGGEKIPTSIAGLMKRGDTHMFKATVELQDAGQTVRYTLYLRPDCSNFLMVPEQFNNKAFGATSGKLPIIIPWTVIPHLIPGGGSGAGSLPIDGNPIDLPNVPGPVL